MLGVTGVVTEEVDGLGASEGRAGIDGSESRLVSRPPDDGGTAVGVLSGAGFGTGSAVVVVFFSMSLFRYSASDIFARGCSGSAGAAGGPGSAVGSFFTSSNASAGVAPWLISAAEMAMPLGVLSRISRDLSSSSSDEVSESELCMTRFGFFFAASFTAIASALFFTALRFI